MTSRVCDADILTHARSAAKRALAENANEDEDASPPTRGSGSLRDATELRRARIFSFATFTSASSFFLSRFFFFFAPQKAPCSTAAQSANSEAMDVSATSQSSESVAATFAATRARSVSVVRVPFSSLSSTSAAANAAAPSASKTTGVSRGSARFERRLSVWSVVSVAFSRNSSESTRRRTRACVDAYVGSRAARRAKAAPAAAAAAARFFLRATASASSPKLASDFLVSKLSAPRNARVTRAAHASTVSGAARFIAAVVSRTAQSMGHEFI